MNDISHIDLLWTQLKSSAWASLLGHKIATIVINSDNTIIGFVTPSRNETIFLETYSECCSDTWFTDIVDVHNLIGGTVIGIEILPDEEKSLDEKSTQEADIHYGVILKTEKGTCKIIYRNSSNGIYGGSIHSWQGEIEKESWRVLNTDLI